MQYGYADFQPSQAYYAFAQAAGCFNGQPYGNTSRTIFECLVSKDTKVLQRASFQVSLWGTYGTWAFLPVTDGAIIQQRPTEQLLKKQVNGVRILSGNNADEGPPFVQQTVRTEEDFLGFLRKMFPLFTNDDISKVLRYYPSTNDSFDLKDPRFGTLGYTGPTALNESSYATGQQQRANVGKLNTSDPFYYTIANLGSRTCTPKALLSVLPTGLLKPSRTSLEQLTDTNYRSQSPPTAPIYLATLDPNPPISARILSRPS